MLHIVKLLCEKNEYPIGLAEKDPLFGWRLASDKDNTYQTSYQIKVFQQEELQWDSGVVFSEESGNICYEGNKLVPHTWYR